MTSIDRTIALLPEYEEHAKLIHAAYSIHRAEVEVLGHSDDLTGRQIRARALVRIEELARRLGSASADDLRRFEVETWGASASQRLPSWKRVSSDEYYDLRKTAGAFLHWAEEWTS